MRVINWIFRFLKKDLGNGLVFKKTSSRPIEVYTKAKWAGCPVDWRSPLLDICSFVYGKLVIVRSSAEAKFALTQGICEKIWLTCQVDWHFICEKIEGKVIVLDHLPSHLQAADILTEALFHPNFTTLSDMFNLVNIYCLIWGAVWK